MHDDELEPLLLMMNSKTSLEELLDWDYDLVEYLIGAWGVVSKHIDKMNDKDMTVALLSAQLPRNQQEKYQKKLEQWLHDNYNVLVR
jgi:hypothetical protein